MYAAPFIPKRIDCCGGAYKVIDRKSPDRILIKDNAGSGLEGEPFAQGRTNLGDARLGMTSDDRNSFKIRCYILDRNIFHNDKFVEPGLDSLGIILAHDKEEGVTLIDDQHDIDYPPLFRREDGGASFAIP